MRMKRICYGVSGLQRHRYFVFENVIAIASAITGIHTRKE